jgi:hypothetical protein
MKGYPRGQERFLRVGENSALVARECVFSAVYGTPPIVLVLDFFGRGKRADCQQRSKIENENDDEDDWRGAYTALTNIRQHTPARAAKVFLAGQHLWERR